MLKWSEIARRAFVWSGRQPSQMPVRSGHGLPEPPLDPALQALIPLVRERLDIDETQASDADIALSLRAIRARPDHKGRWLAAFNSKVGQTIAGRGSSAAGALHMLVTLVPGTRL